MSAPCAHEVTFHGLCATCGADVSSEVKRGLNESYFTTRDLVLKGLQVRAEVARAESEEAMARCLRERKLYLILDLDETLVNQTTLPSYIAHYEEKVPLPFVGPPGSSTPRSTDAPAVSEESYTSRAHAVDDDIYRIFVQHRQHLIRIRPHAREFLKRVSELCELHIYTMGQRQYADRIAQLLDPQGTLFKSRIYSRTDFGDVTTKDLKALFPCDDSMALIVDDRLDVWDFAPNVLCIEPFRFFRAHWAAAGPDAPTPSSMFNQIDDDHLLQTLGRLEHVYATFFRGDVTMERHPDVKDILLGMRNSILAGCSVVFSGIIRRDLEPTLSPHWKLVERLGGKCEHNVSARTTHVIAAEAATEKVVQARRRGGVSIVNELWLMQCTTRWQRMDESAYPIEGVGPTPAARPAAPAAVSAPAPAHQSTADAPSAAAAVGEARTAEHVQDGDEQDGGRPSVKRVRVVPEPAPRVQAMSRQAVRERVDDYLSESTSSADDASPGFGNDDDDDAPGAILPERGTSTGRASAAHHADDGDDDFDEAMFDMDDDPDTERMLREVFSLPAKSTSRAPNEPPQAAAHSHHHHRHHHHRHHRHADAGAGDASGGDDDDVDDGDDDDDDGDDNAMRVDDDDADGDDDVDG